MIQRYAPAFILLVLFILGLEALIRIDFISQFLMPKPTDVWRALVYDSTDLFSATWNTLQCALIGLSLSFVVGFSLAVFGTQIHFLKSALLPFASFFQTVPIIALAPMMVIWFGFGNPTVIAASFIASLFPIIANTLVGLEQKQQNLEELFSIYHASSLQKLFKLQIPIAVPFIFAGLKVSAGLAVIGAIVGEFVGGGGLGSIIDSARTQQRIDKVFAAVILCSIMGLLMIYLIEFIRTLIYKKFRV